MGRKTRLMKRIEEDRGEPLETLIPRMLNQGTAVEAAAELGVANATLSYWLLKLGISWDRVALSPGESIQVSQTLTDNN